MVRGESLFELLRILLFLLLALTAVLPVYTVMEAEQTGKDHPEKFQQEVTSGHCLNSPAELQVEVALEEMYHLGTIGTFDLEVIAIRAQTAESLLRIFLPVYTLLLPGYFEALCHF